MARLPIVAIVGRPNVGKSTLFNRLVGGQEAIVEDRPGVTRDRFVREVEWQGRHVQLVDTGGWTSKGSPLDDKVNRQVEDAVRDSDLVLFLVDLEAGLTDEDERIAEWLRRTGRPVRIVANKADNASRDAGTWEFLALGYGDPVTVSALHGRHSGDLLDDIMSSAEAREPEDPSGPPVVDAPRLAIVGRPNVGKSTLFNRLVGEERSVVHDMPGTTRDAIDTAIETPDGRIVVVDTAGMRRKAKVDDPTEYFSLVRALRAVDEADVALLVIDSTEGVTGQDQRLAERIVASGSPVVIVLNKWEVLAADDREEIERSARRQLSFLGDAPMVRISALTGRGVGKVLPLVAEAIERYRTRVSTTEVNRIIADAQQRHPAGADVRILYALQGSANPPTFTLFATRDLAQHYVRYLERCLRERLDLGSTPIVMRVRTRRR